MKMQIIKLLTILNIAEWVEKLYVSKRESVCVCDECVHVYILKTKELVCQNDLAAEIALVDTVLRLSSCFQWVTVPGSVF